MLGHLVMMHMVGMKVVDLVLLPIELVQDMGQELVDMGVDMVVDTVVVVDMVVLILAVMVDMVLVPWVVLTGEISRMDILAVMVVVASAEEVMRWAVVTVGLAMVMAVMVGLGREADMGEVTILPWEVAMEAAVEVPCMAVEVAAEEVLAVAAQQQMGGIIHIPGSMV